MSDLQQFILNKLEKLDEKLDSIREDNAGTKASLEAHSVRDEQIHEDVKKMSARVDEHSKLLSDYNKQLEVHIKRSELLESRQCEVEHAVAPIIKEFNEEKTVEKWSDQKWAKRMKIVGYIGVGLGALATAIKVIPKIIAKISLGF